MFNPMQWYPIDCAPLDKIIQLWRGGEWDVGNFYDDKNAKYPKPYWFSYYVIGRSVAWMRSNPPTHWMPMPDGPENL